MDAGTHNGHIMLCGCRFISCSTYTTSVEDVDNEGGCECVAAGGIWDILVTSAPFCFEPKIALKNKVYF